MAQRTIEILQTGKAQPACQCLGVVGKRKLPEPTREPVPLLDHGGQRRRATSA